jgi:hypothetical protein
VGRIRPDATGIAASLASPQTQMASVGERRIGWVAVLDEGAEVRGSDGRGDGHADGAAEVLGGVDQAKTREATDAVIQAAPVARVDPATLRRRSS